MTPDAGIAFHDVLQLKWLLVVVGCAAVFIYGFVRKGRALRGFVAENLISVLVPGYSRGRQIVRAVIVLVAMVLIVLALVGPQWGVYWERAQQVQLDLVVCVDVSRSMLARDAGMSRLERATDDIKRLLDRLGGGAIGLVAFAGRGDLVCPLTDDYDFYRLVLEDVGTHSAPLGGTDIGHAIKTANQGFGAANANQRAILVITDGEDHGDTAIEAARQAYKDGALVFCVGVGDDERGALIPIENGDDQQFLTHEGQQVWSRLNPGQLSAIARAGGGAYFRSRLVRGNMRTLEWIYEDKLAPLEERSRDQQFVQRKHARFHWFAGAAIVLLMIEPWIRERRSAVQIARMQAEERLAA